MLSTYAPLYPLFALTAYFIVALGLFSLRARWVGIAVDADGAWRTFGLRKDFHPAIKIQTEDDITASVVVPASALGAPGPQSLSCVQPEGLGSHELRDVLQ